MDHVAIVLALVLLITCIVGVVSIDRIMYRRRIIRRRLNAIRHRRI